MNLQSAADNLMKEIKLPPGMANVLPISTRKGGELIVWIDSRYLYYTRNVPSSYEGYKVFVEARPDISAQA